MVDELMARLQPVLASSGLELVDVEMRSGVLLVSVDRPDGVDLEALTEANRVVSGLLDEMDPIPGRYTLEVSSPGVERTLRRPAHFTKAVGESVSVKTRPQVPGERRLRGRLVEADDDGFLLEVEGGPDVPVRLAYADVDRVRTVFVWGPERPHGQRPRQPAPGKTTEKTTTEKTAKRKQVVTP